MVVWTDAMKAKRAATWAAKRAKKEARLAKANGHREGTHEVDVLPAANDVSNDGTLGFDWEMAPLSQAVQKAAELKKEYERVATIIQRRQNPPKQMWVCWTEENKKLLEIPKKVLQECLRKGEDGKWKFRDDGRFVVENGVRVLRPAFCCNYLCYAAYTKHRVTPPARER